MKLFTPSAALAIFVAAVMTKVAAFPAQINSRVFTAGFTLYGVDPNDQYFLGVPVDDNLHQISMPFPASLVPVQISAPRFRDSFDLGVSISSDKANDLRS